MNLRDSIVHLATLTVAGVVSSRADIIITKALVCAEAALTKDHP
jgi:hypothetical protein